MDEQLARAIWSELKTEEIVTTDPPEDIEELITEGQYWYNEAQKQYEKGERSDIVLAILNLVEGQVDVVADQNKEELTPDPPKDEKVRESYPRRSSGGISEADEREAQEATLRLAEDLRQGAKIIIPRDLWVKQENLPIPHELDEEPRAMPRDLTKLGEEEVRYLAGYYNAYLSRATWLLAVAQSDLANATHLRDDAYKKAFKYNTQELVKAEQKATKDLVDAYAVEDEDYVKYNTDVRKFADKVQMLKALVTIYGSNVDRLSREATLRHNEWERSK